MLQISKYSSIIFDCDGVLLDSNNFKIGAMRDALYESGYPLIDIEKAVASFKANFGKSRFYHVEKFIELLDSNSQMALNSEASKRLILKAYSSICQSAYKNCEVIEGAIDFLKLFKGDSYVASGSEEVELKSVLDYKAMSPYFVSVLGSPVKKSQNISTILVGKDKSSFVMVGDSEADYIAAKENEIDFIFFSPFSNTKEKMFKLALDEKFLVVNSFLELKSNI